MKAVVRGVALPAASMQTLSGSSAHLGYALFGSFKARMRHPIRGLLIGPLIAPIAYWVGVMAYAWVSDFRLSWVQALRELRVIAAFGLPMAYAAALVWGAPVLYALHRFGWLRAATVIPAGAIGGAIFAVLFDFAQQGSFFRARMSVPGGAVLGALVGAACWWSGEEKA